MIIRHIRWMIKLTNEKVVRSDMHIRMNIKVVTMLLLITMLTSACVKEQEPLILGEKNTDQKNIKVLYAGVEANVDSIRYAAEKYETQTGIEVIVDSYPMSAMREKLFAEVASQNSYYDIYLVNSPWLAKIAPDLLDLVPLIKNKEYEELEKLSMDDFIPAILSQCIYDQENPSKPLMDYLLPEFVWRRPFNLDDLESSRFELIGLPFHSNVMTLAYRRDFFENPTLKEMYLQRYGRELKPPENWDEFLEISKFFTRSYNTDSPCDFGTTLMARKHESLYYDWRTWIRSFGANEIGSEMRPEFNSDFAKTATTFYSDLINVHQVTPTDVLAYTWNQAADEFASGGTAMAMNYQRIFLDSSVERRGGKVGFTLVPGEELNSKTIIRAPHYSTYILAINKYSNNQEIAYDFIVNSVSPTWQKEYAPYLFQSSRMSYYNDLEVIQTYPEYLLTFYESLQIGYGTPRIVDYIEYSEIIQNEISHFLYGDKSLEEAFDDADQLVKELLNSNK